MTDVKLTSEPYVAPRKANPFDAVVAQAVDRDNEAGVPMLHKFIAPSDMTPGYAKVQLQKAARDAGLSARIPLDESTKDGQVYGFTLAPRKVRTVKNAATVEEDEAAAAEADSTEKG